MEVQTLSHAGALSPGSRLWILPESPDQSSWVGPIDWYLNFQLSRARNHHPSPLAPNLLNMAHEIGFKVFYTPVDPGPYLMVVSKNLLPNENTLFLKFEDNSQWIESGRTAWKNLGRPSLRIFLPKGLPPSSIQSAYKEDLPRTNITIALDRRDS